MIQVAVQRLHISWHRFPARVVDHAAMIDMFPKQSRLLQVIDLLGRDVPCRIAALLNNPRRIRVFLL